MKNSVINLRNACFMACMMFFFSDPGMAQGTYDPQLYADASSVDPAVNVTINKLMIYPKPAYEFLHVEMHTKDPAIVRLRVEDTAGEEVYDLFRLAEVDGAFSCRLDIRELEKGVYKLHIEDASGGELERHTFEKR